MAFIKRSLLILVGLSIIAAFVALHVWALHVVGQNNPDGVEVKDVERDTVAFTPYATIKDVFALSVFLIALTMWLVRRRAT